MRPPDLQFWVMRDGGKKYKARLSSEINPHTGEVKWKAGKPYLDPESEMFESYVRSCCEKLDPKMSEWVRLVIELHYPIEVSKKGKHKYPKRGRVDCTNLQKSVEDAIQKQRVPWNLRKRRTVCLEKIATSEINPMIKGDFWRDQLLIADAAIRTFREVDTFRGAVMKNDSGTHHITTIIRWRPPETPKCVRVSVWEVQPEDYHTKELTEWLRNQ